MGDTTGISWCDHTFNGWWGCSRVSPACRFCYADRDARRWGLDLWHRNGDRRILSDRVWQRPVAWNRAAQHAGVPAKVFASSMGDVFEDHPQLAEPRRRLWDLIDRTPWLRWQLLTKRPENIAAMAPWGDSWPANVWIGTSAETQPWLERRISYLRALPDSVAVRFLSCEPLLGPVDLRHAGALGGADGSLPHRDPANRGVTIGRRDSANAALRRPGVDWVIAGGESGPGARPMHPDWARSLRDQCEQAEVPFFFKQWGAFRWVAGSRWDEGTQCWIDHGIVPQRVPKKLAGRELDGRTWDQFPLAADLAGAR